MNDLLNLAINIIDETIGQPIANLQPTVTPRWRAKQGGEFAYLTINSYGKVRVNKSYDYRHTPEDSLYESGDYFKVSEATKFAEILTIFLKNRI